MSVPKRIALFIPSLPRGGAEKVLVALANAFRGAGHPVDMILATSSDGDFDDLEPSVDVVDLGAGRASRATIPLVRYLRRRRPTVLMSTLHHGNCVAAVARGIARVPSRLVLREAISPSESLRHTPGLTARFTERLLGRLYRSADTIVAISQGVADDLVTSFRIPADRVVVIHNPVDLDRLERMSREPIVVLSLWPPTILGIGRLHPQKDFQTLLTAFSRVRRLRPSRLMIVGDGPQRSALQEHAASLGVAADVSFVGFVPNPQPYLRNASVYVLSSRWEGLGNTLLEALVQGTPTVATDCPSGPREALEAGRWGRLVPVGDAAAMADAIIAGLDGQLVSPPRAHIESRFGIQRISKQYLQVLTSTEGECPWV